MGKKADFRPERVRNIPEGEPFVMLPGMLLNSPAWRVAGINVRRVVEFLMIEHLNHGGTENGHLLATFDQLVGFGVSRRLIKRSMEQAEQLGLIDIQPGHRGGFARNKPNRFGLTFARVKSIDEFGRTTFSYPSHRYQKVSQEQAARIVGRHVNQNRSTVPEVKPP